MSENFEILEEFYKECKEYSLEEVIERWSGIGLCIPAFTGKIRDIRIKEDFNALNDNLSCTKKYVILAKRYRVSKRKVIQAVKSTTPTNATTTPSLFDA